MAQKTLKRGQRPLVYLVVILPILVFGGVSFVCTLILAYSRTKGIPQAAVPKLNGMLISLPALGLWIPISLLLANLVIFCVAPLRRVAERYTAQAERSGFIESQKDLMKLLLVLALICIPLIVLGFVL
jgi:hypothetical protein